MSDRPLCPVVVCGVEMNFKFPDFLCHVLYYVSCHCSIYMLYKQIQVSSSNPLLQWDMCCKDDTSQMRTHLQGPKLTKTMHPPFKRGHLSNKDTSVIRTPLKWRHLSNKDTSANSNSKDCIFTLGWTESSKDTSASTFYLLKRGHLFIISISSFDKMVGVIHCCLVVEKCYILHCTNSVNV